MPSKSVLVEIVPLFKPRGPQQKGLKSLLAGSRIKGIACKNIYPIYRLEGNLDSATARAVARELLCDPIAEKFLLDPEPANPKTLFVDVWFKPGVTDSAGDSILKAIADLK